MKCKNKCQVPLNLKTYIMEILDSDLSIQVFRSSAMGMRTLMRGVCIRLQLILSLHALYLQKRVRARIFPALLHAAHQTR